MARKIIKIVFIYLLIIVPAKQVCCQELDHSSSMLAKRLDSLMTNFYKKNIFTGTVLVAKKGNIIYQKGFGYADLEWNIANASDTKFGIASLTKPFTALRLLQLADSGIISLDDKISKYVLEFKGKAAENTPSGN